MKFYHIILLSIIYISITACHSQKNTQSATTNPKIIDTRGNRMLLGKSKREQLRGAPFGQWFNQNYSDYQIDTVIANALRPQLKNKRFVIFMGTWCGDSRDEVPKIYKLLDYCGVPDAQIQLINLSVYDSVYKQSPNREERGLNIHRVPDLLVYEKQTELGRVVEKPVISWERDLLAIALRKNYHPHYKIVTYLHTLFQTRTLDKIEIDILKIADSLQTHITKNEGLQSYGAVLLAADEYRKAMFVLQLNSLLYPSSANAFVSLGDAYLKVGKRFEAKQNYERALTIQPGHEKALGMLTQLMR
jgi:tetratricopeptide (TPR) repeat protein